MNDTIEHERTTDEQQPAPLTKRALIERGIEALPPADASVTVQHHASGGVSQVNLPQVVEIAKFMAAAGQGVPEHCQGNVGICLRVTFQAVEWQMSPFSVADMSYVVNKRLAYMSQLVHAVVEARAPLQHRLDCKYDGDGDTRTCTVSGMFTTGDVREYTTPTFAKIRVKNSPLWKDDPDQQLFYYAARAWARKWCPDVLLGVYTKEELQDSRYAAEAGITPEAGLHARLSKAGKSDEGHKVGHVDKELAQLATGGTIIDHDADETQTAKKKKGKAAAEPIAAETDRLPTTSKEYLGYFKEWLKPMDDADEIDARWSNERRLRNKCGVTADERLPLEALKIDHVEALSKKKKK